MDLWDPVVSKKIKVERGQRGLPENVPALDRSERSRKQSAIAVEATRAPRCIEEGCEKQAQGGMKGRCKRHAREQGDTPSAPRCKEEGCEKYVQGGMKGRCTRHGRLHAEKGGDP